LPTLPKGTIEASEIWKRFRADDRPTYLQDQLARARDRVRHRGEGPRWRWVLSDVNFRAEPGESWGLVGANGAGKSTLMKMLTRVMYPTAGKVTVGGRVGALIEVRAGISPLLTGRENVYLTGAIMGLKRADVTKRFDEIVAFANLEEAVDRQVKYYSTGMQMRLGFAVAAFLSPDILLVDEVLAVGDATFQQRCLERIRTVLSEGATLVFVSHDLAAVEASCTNGVFLADGRVQRTGPIREVLSAYRAAVEGAAAEAKPQIQGLIKVHDVTAGGPGGELAKTGGPLEVTLTIESPEEHRAWIYLGISEGAATPIFVVNPGHEHMLKPGLTRVRLEVPSLPLPAGRFYVWGGVYKNWTNGLELISWQPMARFDVYGPEIDAAPKAVVRLSALHVDSEWDFSDQDVRNPPASGVA
jgi:ABC-type polysaccharide/polyol phosphate transport system ATPase subunit